MSLDKANTQYFEATRKAGEACLKTFTPQTGKRYTNGRNFDRGAVTFWPHLVSQKEKNIDRNSPFIRIVEGVTGPIFMRSLVAEERLELPTQGL